jgi:hypothetical protein
VTGKRISEEYLVSVTDSDGDQVLMAFPLQALHYKLASKQTIAIVLW